MQKIREVLALGEKYVGMQHGPAMNWWALHGVPHLCTLGEIIKDINL